MPPTEEIDLTLVDDLRDVVHRAVACLAQGGIMVLPTSTHRALAASALRPAAIDRLVAIHGESHPLSLALHGSAEVADWQPNLSLVGRRLTRRLWPGPVTFLLQGDLRGGLATRLDPVVARHVCANERLGLKIPDHSITCEIARLLPGPIAMCRVPETASIKTLARDSLVDSVLEDPTQPDHGGNTVVELDGGSWKILREGPVDAQAVSQSATTGILFVCTGNTCRSPMAEAICKLLLARRLKCKEGELEQHGFHVVSAGLAAPHGARAASHAQEIVESLGGSLRRHTSKPITSRIVDQVDHVLTMTREHLDGLLATYPDTIDRARLLDPSGGDVDDPIGADRETYEETARIIQAHLCEFLDELGIVEA